MSKPDYEYEYAIIDQYGSIRRNSYGTLERAKLENELAPHSTIIRRRVPTTWEMYDNSANEWFVCVEK